MSYESMKNQFWIFAAVALFTACSPKFNIREGTSDFGGSFGLSKTQFKSNPVYAVVPSKDTATNSSTILTQTKNNAVLRPSSLKKTTTKNHKLAQILDHRFQKVLPKLATIKPLNRVVQKLMAKQSGGIDFSEFNVLQYVLLILGLIALFISFGLFATWSDGAPWFGHSLDLYVLVLGILFLVNGLMLIFGAIFYDDIQDWSLFGRIVFWVFTIGLSIPFLFLLLWIMSGLLRVF